MRRSRKGAGLKASWTVSRAEAAVQRSRKGAGPDASGTVYRKERWQKEHGGDTAERESQLDLCCRHKNRLFFHCPMIFFFHCTKGIMDTVKN